MIVFKYDGVENSRGKGVTILAGIALIVLVLASWMLFGCQSASLPASPASSESTTQREEADQEEPQAAEAAEGADSAEEADSADYSNVVRQFCYAFYDQWSFIDGVFTSIEPNTRDQVLPFIDPQSDIYAEVLSGEPGTAGYIGVAYWLQDVTVTKLDDFRYLAEVSAYGTQNTVTQELFDRMTEEGPYSFEIAVRLNEDGLITWFGDPSEEAAQATNSDKSSAAELADGWYGATLIAPGQHQYPSTLPEVNEASLEGDILFVSGTLNHAQSKEGLFGSAWNEDLGPKTWQFPIGDNVAYRLYGGTGVYEDTTREFLADHLSSPSGLGFYVEVSDGKAVMIALSS